MADIFSVGEEFPNCEQFLLKIDTYMEQTKFILSKRDSHKMGQFCEKRGITNNFPDFTFYDLHFVCPKSGKFVTKGKGKRKAQ